MNTCKIQCALCGEVAESTRNGKFVCCKCGNVCIEKLSMGCKISAKDVSKVIAVEEKENVQSEGNKD